MGREPSGREGCGICGEKPDPSSLSHGKHLAVCQRCVREGLAATVAQAATVRDGATVPNAFDTCGACRKPTPPSSLFRRPGAAEEACICAVCLAQAYQLLTQTLELAGRRRASFHEPEQATTAALLEKHFEGLAPTDVVTASRTFPRYLRPDLVRALVTVWEGTEPECVGVHTQHNHEALTYSSLIDKTFYPARVAPLKLEAVNVGEGDPVECPKVALWLGESDVKYALLLSESKEYGRSRGWQVELCVPAGPKGQAFATRALRRIEQELKTAATYRGKILSLDCEANYRGMEAGAVVVHRLQGVRRGELILPGRTLELLERNIFRFLEQRERLLSLGLSIKKGLLFYGPPGTGKSHTIRYVASSLPKHTTLLVTADQVALIADYMALSRLLSPSIVVIEDVDLIARDREDLRTPGQESLLNRLLNEMDGLRENSEVLFILTTNRPEALEPALAGRPGRIDQAIEFPLPDAESRRRLVELYRHGLELPQSVANDVVSRTEGVSAAFIKEMMRRTAQFTLERSGTSAVTSADVESALAELLFEGGSLNAKLLGAARSSDA